jgi:hypothetical protein
MRRVTAGRVSACWLLDSRPMRHLKGGGPFHQNPDRAQPRNARAERGLAESMLRTKSGQRSRNTGPQLNLAEIEKS